MRDADAKAVIEEVAEEAAKAGVPITAAAIKAKRELFEAADEPYVEPEQPEVEPLEPEGLPVWDPAVAKKAEKALGQLVRALQALGIEWKKMTLHEISDTLKE